MQMGDATAILVKLLYLSNSSKTLIGNESIKNKIPIEDIRSVMNIHYHFNRTNGNIQH